MLPEIIDSGAAPREKLHQIIDVSDAFHAARPQFLRLLIQLRGGQTITGPVLADYSRDVDDRFNAAMDLLASVVADGRSRGEIRTGNAHALAHLYSVLINEHIFLNAEATARTGTSLSQEEFHALVDDALQPSRRRRRA